MVDWLALDYRKLYVPFSQTFERLPYAARAMGADIIRRCDREGRIVKAVNVTHVTSLPSQVVDDLVFHVRAHSGEETWIRMAVEALLKDGYLVIEEGWLKIRNYVDAQRSTSADRMARKRARESGSQRTANTRHSDVTDSTSDGVRHSDESDQEERRGEEKYPHSPLSDRVPIREVCRRAYSEGARAALGVKTFAVLDGEADVIVQVVRDEPAWSGQRGEGLATAIRNSVVKYVGERREDGKFERGFAPSKWAEWLRGGGASQRKPTGPDLATLRTNQVQEELLRKATSR